MVGTLIKIHTIVDEKKLHGGVLGRYFLFFFLLDYITLSICEHCVEKLLGK